MHGDRLQREVWNRMHEKIRALFFERELENLGTVQVARELGISTRTAWKHLNRLREEGVIVKEGRKYRLNLERFAPTAVFEKYVKLLEKGCSAVGNPEKSPVTIFVLPGDGLVRLYKTYELVDLVRRSFTKAALLAGDDAETAVSALAPKGYYMFGFLINAEQLLEWLKTKSRRELDEYAFAVARFKLPKFVLIPSLRDALLNLAKRVVTKADTPESLATKLIADTRFKELKEAFHAKQKDMLQILEGVCEALSSR